MTKLLRNSLIVIAVLTAAFFLFKKKPNSVNNELTAKVQLADFTNTILTSGELFAENSVHISIPEALLKGRARVYDIKITDMVEEGTFVDSGDYVASLDHSVIMEKINETEEELVEELDNLDEAKLDTNLTLSNQRNNILTDIDNVTENKIIVEQSIYESPSVQRKAQMNLEKSLRILEQSKRAYELQVRKSTQRIEQREQQIQRKRKEIEDYKIIFESLDIKAPAPGMVIYARDWNNNKLQIGSQVSRWRPEIAELPDLSKLISRTFVNEIDISNVKKNQFVEVGIDAFPERSFKGEVISVSNIGQAIPNKNTKVFQVDIRLMAADTLLKPSMTTKNEIYAHTQKEVLILPIDAVFFNDSLQYVYSLSKKTRKIVQLGEENQNFVIVLEGLEKGEKVKLNPPADPKKWPFSNLDLYIPVQDSTLTNASIQ